MKKLSVYILLLCILIVGCKQQESADPSMEDEHKENAEETRVENEKEADDRGVGTDEAVPSSDASEVTEDSNNSNEREDSIPEGMGEEINREVFTMDVTGSKDLYTVEMIEYRLDTIDEETGEDSHIIVHIYAGETQTKPIQTFDHPIYSGIFGDYDTVDANFDGYQDFYYVSERGNINYTCKFFLWDGEKKEFVEATVLNDISMPKFDAERKVIEGYWHDSAASNETKYYQYIDGAFICIRSMNMGYPTFNEDGTANQQLIVKDYDDGQLVTVFDEQTLLDDAFEGPVYDAFFKWKDIDYTGKE